jgi:hypothetical protein
MPKGGAGLVSAPDGTSAKMSSKRPKTRRAKER